MRPVRASSCFSRPFFSTACCAVISPTANSTAVVTLCVNNGREASFRWYLDHLDQQFAQYIHYTYTGGSAEKRLIYVEVTFILRTSEAWLGYWVMVPLLKGPIWNWRFEVVVCCKFLICGLAGPLNLKILYVNPQAPKYRFFSLAAYALPMGWVPRRTGLRIRRIALTG